MMPHIWQDAMRLAVKKFEYEKLVNSWSRLSLWDKMKHLPLLFKVTRAKDPCPELNSEGLALRYVNLFHQAHPLFGHRDTVYVGMGRVDTLAGFIRYDAADRLPVLSVTYYEDGTAYQEKTKFFQGGGRLVIPVTGYMREVTIDGLPERPEVKQLCQMKEFLPAVMEEIASVLRDI